MIAKTPLKKNGGLKRANWLPPVLTVVFLLLAGLLIFSNLQMAKRKGELGARIAELEKGISDLQEKNEELRSSLSFLSQESYLEKEAREKLQLKKPGEKVVTVLTPEPSPTTSPANQPQNIWETLLDKLGL